MKKTVVDEKKLDSLINQASDNLLDLIKKKEESEPLLLIQDAVMALDVSLADKIMVALLGDAVHSRTVRLIHVDNPKRECKGCVAEHVCEEEN